MPTRNMQQFIPRDITIVTTWNGSSSTRVYKDTQEVMLRDRTWERTSNYREIIAARSRARPAELPMNNYTDFVRVTEPSAITKLTVIPDYWYGNSHVMTGPLQIALQSFPGVDDPILTSVLYNSALAKLPSKMNGNSFNLPLFIGEVQKTAKMIGDLTTDMLRFVRSLQRGRDRVVTRRDVDGLWMEYRYGWRLAVKDIVDACIAIYDACQKGVLQKAVASAKYSRTSTDAVNALYIGDPNLSVCGDLVKRCEETFETRFTLWYKDDHPFIGTMQQFGLTNPFTLGYEFVRLSFVFDWAFNVGDFLSSIDAFLGKSFVRGCVSYKRTQKNYWYMQNIRSANTDSYPRMRVVPTSLSGKTEIASVYKRVPLGSFPTASLPTLNPSLNLERSLDAISLLKQAILPPTRNYQVRVRF